VLVEVGEPEPLAGVPGRFRGWPTEVVVVGIGTFLTWQLGFDPRAGISTRDWPVTPQQSLAGQWRRIAQEEHFPGRADEVGDDLGRRVLVARLARDVMRLCFLLERRYAPYSKWLGTAFARLESAAAVGPLLGAAMGSDRWPEAERALVRAYREVADRHNRLALTERCSASAPACAARSAGSTTDCPRPRRPGDPGRAGLRSPTSRRRRAGSSR
jgi:hypothetical protein